MRRARQEGPPRRLAIRAPNWVGDLVMATATIDAACADPRIERIDVLLRAALAPLLADQGWRARLVPIASRREERAIYRRLAPDAALLLASSAGAAWRARDVPVRAGVAIGLRRHLLTHVALPPTRAGRRVPVPTAHAHRDAAGLLGILVDDLRPRLVVGEPARRRARELLGELGLAPDERYHLAAPGAGFGASKLWPPGHFARALDRLHEERGARAVLTGGPNEDAALEAVRERCRHRALSLAGRPRDLSQLAALVAGADLVLVGDSGPRWVAAALGVPCVVVMGPNFPELTATALERTRVLRVVGLECAPCLERRCPLGHHRCLVELDPERAVRAALELLRQEVPAA